MVTRRSLAHWNAWLAGFKHRDISAGNLLVKITYVMEDGVMKAQWDGILCDWELSTAVTDTGDSGNPHATGRVVGSMSQASHE